MHSFKPFDVFARFLRVYRVLKENINKCKNDKQDMNAKNRNENTRTTNHKPRAKTKKTNQI